MSKRSRPTPDYSFQKNDIIRLLQEIEGRHSPIYVLPTGGGKTHVAAAVILDYVRRGKRVLFVAHRREIVGQAVDEVYGQLVAAGLNEEMVGVVMAGDRRARPVAPVQIASVDTLRRRTKPKADLLILDEAHRSAAKTWRKLAAYYPKSRRLGLTATPYRLDHRGLAPTFDVIVEGPDMERLHAMGVLTMPRIWSVDPGGVNTRLKSVRTVRGDYDKREISRIMRGSAMVGPIVQHYERLGHGLRAIVFAVDVRHAKELCRRFKAAGHRAAVLHGETPLAERRETLANLRSGALRVVVNCEILTEGFDCPPAKVCIMARPTKSTGLCLQMVGRFLRPWRGQRPIVLDHAGNVLRHGLPWANRPFTLAHGLPKDRRQPEAKACPSCGLTVERATLECSNCGHVFVVARDSSETDGQLVEMVPTDDEKREFRVKVEALAAKLKAPTTWVDQVVAGRFAA